MDSSVLLAGRPFGGCAILFRKSLSSCIAPLCCDSNRFGTVRLIDFCGVSYLLVCVYMPSDLHLLAYCDYIQILGELEVFISIHNCDVNVIVDDFNVDFDRDVRLTDLDLLRVFVSDLDLSVCVIYSFVITFIIHNL